MSRVSSADLLRVSPRADRTAPVARANPVAKVAVATVISVALILTVDVVTAGVALVLELVCLPLCGLPLRSVLRRSWLLALAALPAGVVTVLVGRDSGALLVGLGPVSVTEGSALLGAAISLRILAIGLPGVVLLATTDPTDLADALAQVLRLPHRFVLAALAALRLFGVLHAEWQLLSLARRARGLGDDGVLGTARTAARQVFALLVVAIRRATTLATAMEARGFGVATRRTWARPSRLSPSDAVVVLGGVGVAAAATAAGVLAGTWRLLLT